MDPLEHNDPERIGRFRLTHRLGAGGMGLVYLARTASGRRVAIKVIRTEYSERADFRARFAREVAAARKVGGFHTAQVLDADTEAEKPWVASTFIPGPSLHGVISAEGPLTAPALTALAVGLAEGLQAIHAHGLTHRDLKPSNIIMADDGPRIIDFGIARPDEDTRITETGAVLGTPAYMAPEQARGDTESIGPSVDVFALGSVLHFAATGSNPFRGRTPLNSISRLLSIYPVVARSVAEPIRGIIVGCWRRDPDLRPTPDSILARLGEINTDHDWALTRTPTEPTAPEPAPTARARVEELIRTSNTKLPWLGRNANYTARMHHEQAMDLRNLGQHEEALKADARALALHRRLAEQDYLAHRHELVVSLRNLAVDLNEVERYEEALEIGNDAVTLYRELAAYDPGTHKSGLGSTLINLGSTLGWLDRHEDALEAESEAVSLFEELAEHDHEKYTSDLAIAYRNRAYSLIELGRHAEAAELSAVALALYRELTERDHAGFQADIAHTLFNRTMSLFHLGRHAEALDAVTEAISRFRELIAQGLAIHTVHLGTALQVQSKALGALGRREEAYEAGGESTALFQELAEHDPAEYTGVLAESLHHQASNLHYLGRHEEALESATRAIALYREAPAYDPDEYYSDLASALHDQALHLSNLGRHQEAQAALREATSLRRDNL